VARVLRDPVQRHVMGPLVRKQLSNSFAARTGRTVANHALVTNISHTTAKCVNGIYYYFVLTF